MAEEVGLRRALGLRTVVSTSTGLAFAALEYLAMAGLIAYAAGSLAWISVAVAGLLAVVAWGFYGELNGLYPTAAAVRRYMAKSMDDRIALTVTFTYLSAIVLVIAADAFIVGSAVAHVLGQPSWLVAVYIGVLLGLAAVANLQGLVVAGAVQDVATFTIVVTTAVIGGFITASRFNYATAREGSLPSGFARLNVNFVPWVPVVVLAATSLVVGVIVALSDSWQVLVAVGAALEAMIYAVAGLCVIQLRNREPDSVRPFRLWAGKPLAWGGMVMFAVLAVGASVSVNNRFDPLPLGIIAVMAGLSACYVLVYLPKLKAANAAQALAAIKRRRPPSTPPVS